MNEAPPSPRPEVETMPFEAALAELEQIVARLESPGGVALDDSIALYERGEALKRRCETLLRAAEMRIEKIALGADGTPTGTAPMEDAG